MGQENNLLASHVYVGLTITRAKLYYITVLLKSGESWMHDFLPFNKRASCRCDANQRRRPVVRCVTHRKCRYSSVIEGASDSWSNIAILS